MAQQSARRGRENQGFPQCFEHALGDLDPARELPYRPAADHRCITGRTDGSIRLRATTIPKFPLAKKGASTDGKADAEDLLHQRPLCAHFCRSIERRCSSKADVRRPTSHGGAAMLWEYSALSRPAV